MAEETVSCFDQTLPFKNPPDIWPMGFFELILRKNRTNPTFATGTFPKPMVSDEKTNKYLSEK